MTDKQHIGAIVRLAREKRGLTEDFCAQQCGLTRMEYYDLEAYDDEFFDNISMGTARRISLLLGLDLVGLVAKHVEANIADRSYVDDARFFSRDALVREGRLKKTMTQADLADAIGFETMTIQELEHSPDYIECLPIRVVVDVAVALGIDPGSLVCNR